jgi:hypothetical protein
MQLKVSFDVVVN